MTIFLAETDIRRCGMGVPRSIGVCHFVSEVLYGKAKLTEDKECL
jgi:hypothetical protein